LQRRRRKSSHNGDLSTYLTGYLCAIGGATVKAAPAGSGGVEIANRDPNIGFGAHTTLAYAANAAGTLTVSDGRHAACIALLGNYIAGTASRF
jgi:hypothetical protein